MIEIRERRTIPGDDTREDSRHGKGISPATRLALILTLRLDRTTTTDSAGVPFQPRPLDASEMTRLARWLQEQGRDALALPSSPDAMLDGWQDRTISAERLLALVARQETIDRVVQHWSDQGIWILGRKDSGYPRARLSGRLGEAIPPVLFGIGSQDLLEPGGTAIVGSRDTHVTTLNLAQELGSVEAHAGRTVISGGARGVDERAVHGAFLGNGAAVVVLGDGLTRYIGKRATAEPLAAGTLALISPYAPDAAFSTANAMGRNRLIYCLAEEAIVVASSEGTGGTFIGARDALRRGWGPIWIAPSDDPHSGNHLLLRAGGRPLSDRPASQRSPAPNLADAARVAAHPQAVTRAASPAQIPTIPDVALHASPAEKAVSYTSTSHADAAPNHLPPPTPTPMRPGDVLYEAFLACWRMLPPIPAALPDLARGLSLTPEQTRAWVFQAVERGEATRLTNPVRYVVAEKREK
jgi:predicted Rossmann fold nucleotide-binding protein DprA/Smf involved in DNA uptake